MNVTRLAVHRPVLTTMVALVVVILGGVSLARLPVDLMPDITFPTLSVATSYEDASPEEMEELVTRPTEQALSAVPGVEEVNSTSGMGTSQVRLSFAWGTDLDAAANDIRDRLDRVIGRLPEDAERPMLRKFDLASFPIMVLGASSRLDPVEMRRIIDDRIKYRLERVPGVAAIDVWGGREREIHVNLDPDRLKGLELSLDQIISRVRAGNVNVPAGNIERGIYDVLIRTPGEYRSLDEIRNTVVTVREGVPVLLREVATVDDTWPRITRIARVNRQNGVQMSVNKQSGTNTVDVARRVRRELVLLARDIPQIRLVPITDSADYIERSITNVGTTAMYGGLLAVLVLLVFLRSVRSTGVIATAIPLSIIATFALMYFCGFTLNIMTLGGLALGIGMLVDNSIVVLENIYRLHESGVPAERAAVDGADEVASAVIASTLTTVAVFLPLVFMRGMSGVMFRQLAYVVAFALLCSLGVALTVVPMLAARLFRAPRREHAAHSGLLERARRMGTGFTEGMESGYRKLLHAALGHRLIAVAVPVAMLVGALALIPLVGSELMPASDEGEVRIDGEMEVGTRVDVVDRQFRRIEAIVAEQVPELRHMVTGVGGGGFRAAGSHTGNLRLSLVPAAQRDRSSEEVSAALRAALSGIPGMTVRVRAGQGMMRMRGGGSSEAVQVDVRGYELDIGDALAARVEEVLAEVPGVTDVRLGRESGTPEELVRVDRRKAADMNVTVDAVGNMLQTVLTGTRATNYREGGDEFPVIVKLKDAERMDLRDLLDLTITNADGQPVVLRNVVTVEPETGPVRITRKDQERVVTVSANISGRDMGSVVRDAAEKLRSVPVPRGFSIAFVGDYEDQQEAFRELLLSIILALILVYMVMAAQYESLRDPFVIMFSVPEAAIGVILLLLLTNTTFNIQSYIGCIMLGGIVVNNAILLVDQTNLLRRRDGLPLREAIEEAARRRLRPILMTALTTSLAMLPLALALSEGSEAQAPMARALIGGLLSSTLITLVFVPVVYSVFERKTPANDE